MRHHGQYPLESQGGTLTGPVSMTGPIGLALNWTGTEWGLAQIELAPSELAQ
jgi:hypothetical protein